MKFKARSATVYLTTTIKRTIQRLKLSINLRWQRICYSVAFSASSGTLIVPSAIEQLDISNSSAVLNKKSSVFRSALKYWTIAEKYRAKGLWHQGVSLQSEILSELYDYQEISDVNYFPPILGTTWSSNFGHIGQIGIHSLAQNLGILPGGTRVIVESTPTANLELFREVSKHFTTTRQKSGNRWSEMPSFWHMSERMRMVKTKFGFMDFSSLIDEIFSEKNLKILPKHYIELSHENLSRSADLLEKYGLPRNAKFVAFHHRQTSNRSDPTQIEIERFFASIKEITRNGLWVIRFGVPGMDLLPEIPMVIDLISKPEAGRDLNPYILSQSEFFLGQFSGPALPPMAFGVPILGVNVSEVGLAVTNAPEGSKFLPKKYFKRNGKLLKLSETFEKNLGYTQYSDKRLQHFNLFSEPNSTQEILEATREMLDYIVFRKVSKSKFASQLAEIRKYHKVPSSGDFSERFLEKYPDWLK